MLSLKKVVDSSKKYVAKNGKEYSSVSYQLSNESGKYILVRPVFYKDSQWLDMLVNSTEKK